MDLGPRGVLGLLKSRYVIPYSMVSLTTKFNWVSLIVENTYISQNNILTTLLLCIVSASLSNFVVRIYDGGK